MKYKTIRRLFLLSGDTCLLFFSLYLTLFVRKGTSPSLEIYTDFAKNFIWLFLFWLFLLFIFNFYSFKLKTGTYPFFRYFLIYIFLSIFSGILFFYLQPKLAIAPKTILILEVVIFCILFLGWRFVFDWLFRKNIKKEKIIFLGFSPEVKELREYLEKFSSRYKVLGIYPENSDNLKIKEIIKKEKIKRIIVSESPSFKEIALDALNLRDILFSFPSLKIENFIKFYEVNTQRVPLSLLSNSNYLEEFYKEEERTYTILKRIFDIFFSSLGVLVLAIFYPFIALAIKLDSSGPVFFIQKRLGKKRKPFDFYKFRTMVNSSEENEKWRVEEKKYVTRVGKFLRKTHLDELPQFLNILKGDLSFIGPRPEWEKLAKTFEKEIPFYFLRYQVKPGFTGWAQINLPPSLSVEEAKEKFKYDLYYIKHRSFLFDMIVFLKSLRKVFG